MTSQINRRQLLTSTTVTSAGAMAGWTFLNWPETTAAAPRSDRVRLAVAGIQMQVFDGRDQRDRMRRERNETSFGPYPAS